MVGWEKSLTAQFNFTTHNFSVKGFGRLFFWTGVVIMSDNGFPKYRLDHY
jgi:hypothetical protein